MDREDFLEGRHSLNCSITNPAAESTKLNHSNGNSFRWGSSPIGCRQRSNSSLNLVSLVSCAEDTLLDRSRCKNARKIDPRIAADVQSKGLASRIVKYHENGNRLSRSMSAHNLFSKPGQFPIVTLKKTDLPYRASKQNVSMTRIAPPEKSTFYGNTLSSLLRSNSVMALQKSDEDISRENRPILHPPPTENDMAPTRSVLDVLKEISRKRINSDDPSTADTSKKNRLGCDLLDAGTNATASNISPANVTMMAHSFKRQRDVNSHYKMEVNPLSKFQDINKSPEQAKKRICSYNNDITSSLSSSAKRKPHENKRASQQLNHTMPTYLESYESQKVKIQKCNDSHMSSGIRLDNLTSCLNSNNSTTHTQADPSNRHQVAYGGTPQRSKSEPLQKLESAGSALASTQPAQKPRLTLFNKNYDICNETYNDDIANEYEDNLDDKSECAGIHFVKPKKLTSTGLKNPIIERTQKSKLALMLSGLRGELYQASDNDELDSTKQQANARANDLKQTTGQKNDTPPASSNSLNCKSNDNLGPASNASKLPENTSSVQFKVNPSPKNASPLVGLRLAPQSNMVRSDVAQKADVSQQLSTPMLGGFSGNNISCQETPVVAISTSCNTANVSSSTNGVFASAPFGTLKQSQDSKSINTPNGVPAFNFGSTVVKSNTSGTENKAVVSTSVCTSTLPTKSFTLGSSNNTNVRTDNNCSASPVVTSTVVATDLSQLTSSCNATKDVPLKLGSSESSTCNVAFSSSFNFGTNEKTKIDIQKHITDIKPTSLPITASFSFGASSNSASTASSSHDKAPQGISFVPSSADSPNTQFSFGSSVNKRNVSSPLSSAFTFGCSSNKNNGPILNTNTSNVTTPTSSVSALGATSFNQTCTTAGPVSDFPAPSTTSSLFGSSIVAAPPVFGTNLTNNATTFGSEPGNKLPTVFGGSSTVNNALPSIRFPTSSADKVNSTNNTTTVPSVGFSFGAESNTNHANGSFKFGESSTSASLGTDTAAPSKTFTFASNTNACDKRNATNIFGGSINATSEATAATNVGFTFGSGTGAGIEKPSTFSFGSANTLTTTTGNTSSSPPAGFSFGATTPAKTMDNSSNKPFSFGSTLSNASHVSAASNSNQKTSSMFAAPAATKGSSAFNFGATSSTNNQATVIPNVANNIFTLPASASSERPIRRATRRLQK